MSGIDFTNTVGNLEVASNLSSFCVIADRSCADLGVQMILNLAFGKYIEFFQQSITAPFWCRKLKPIKASYVSRVVTIIGAGVNLCLPISRVTLLL